MSDGLEGDDLAVLKAFGSRRRGATVAGRKERETRAVPYSDRRRQKAAGRTEQLNLSFRPGFKKRLTSFAGDHGKTMTAVIEEAVELYIASTGWGEP